MIPRGQETHQYRNFNISTSAVGVNSFISRLTGVERFCPEEDGGGSCRVKITPILFHTASDSPGFFVISFRDELEPQPQPLFNTVKDMTATKNTVIQALEDELQVTGDDLQSTIEKVESTNAELKAAIEEFVSVN
jgi:hypothetical protein